MIRLFVLPALFALYLPAVSAQDALPRPRTPHPETGETGTWIPLWLEKQHVLDDAALKTCRKEIALAEKALAEAEQTLVALHASHTELNVILDEADVRELELRERLRAQDTKLERRARLAWATTGTTTAALGAFALLLWLH